MGSGSNTPPTAATAEGATTTNSTDRNQQQRATASFPPDAAYEARRRVLAERYEQHGRGLDEHYRALERRRPLNPAELRRWAARIEARLARLEGIIEGRR